MAERNARVEAWQLRQLAGLLSSPSRGGRGCCLSHGPDGVVCQKIRGHIGDHGGMDNRGAWRHWLALEGDNSE